MELPNFLKCEENHQEWNWISTQLTPRSLEKLREKAEQIQTHPTMEELALQPVDIIAEASAAIDNASEELRHLSLEASVMGVILGFNL